MHRGGTVSRHLLRRLKMVGSDEAYAALVRANEEVIMKLKRRGMFRMPVLAAMDLSDDRFYGKYNKWVHQALEEGWGDEPLLHPCLASRRRARQEGDHIYGPCPSAR